MDKILIVDDDVTFSRILETFLSRKGYVTEAYQGIRQAQQSLEKKKYDLFLLDYRLPDGTGLDMLDRIRSMGLRTPAIIMTSFSDIRTAVNAIRSGAFDYITKPVNHEELLMLIQQAIESGRVSHDDAPESGEIGSYVEGSGVVSQKLHHEIKLIAPTDMSVIIQGESGTGKEYVARLIHSLSRRRDQPFVAVDCGTLSADLAGSELFGHVRGAFTGALHNKTGTFELAHGGTLFLDEIGNLTYDVQVKLLRALQERLIQPLGSNKTIRIDVRILAATNDDLSTAVSNGKFREDLYHRINEYKLSVPPLRNREEDMEAFVRHFIMTSNASFDKHVKKLSPEVMSLFKKYDWPGNIRELKNIVKRLVLLAEGETAGISGLPEEMLSLTPRTPTPAYDLKAAQEETEKALIERTLREVRYNKSKAAKLLNIDRSTLYLKMEKYGIRG